MEIKILLVLFAFIGSTVSQRVSCDYELRTVNGRQSYTCYMTIDNPNGWNNFTQVEGFHYPGMNNVFVTAIVRNTLTSSTPNVPEIICQQFPHVTYIDMSFLQLQEVGENTFRGCRNLDWLRLYYNRIPSLPENLFIHNRHLTYIDLDSNLFTTFPENLFANQLALQALDLNNNPLTNLPTGIFRNLWSLQTLFLRAGSLPTINPGWFANLINLNYLDLSYNVFNQTIPSNAFANLLQLETFYLVRTGLTTFDQEWFRNMPHLLFLYMYSNRLTSVPANFLVNSPNLVRIDFYDNLITEVSPNAFDNLPQLMEIDLDRNRLTRIHPQWFAGKTNLIYVYLDFNRITGIPIGTFADNNNLQSLGLWDNQIRTINRNSFGNLNRLRTLDLDGNQVTSVDERFLSELTSLYYFYFSDNVCGDFFFFDFGANIQANIQRFATCIRNFGFNIERTTQPGTTYNFVNGYHPGMHLEVNSEQEINIALTPFNVAWIPIVEIVFTNETVRILRNYDTQVAIVPNLGAFKPGGGNRFRVSWFRQVIAVFEGNDPFPFISYTMEDWVPIGWVGLGSQRSRAFWFLEPIEIPQAD
ncbi:leucine-rich repeat-containing protein 15-like [Chironomus tepperi]|uniref:leucine-rich repeat-containing protein 15-like n=1 Tax=Chironomus tepperi TaxID=113505 RepID=UPI00391F720A